MSKKIMSILVCTLLIATVIVNIPNDSSVKASGQGGGNSDYFLNFSYMNDQTEWIGNVIHNGTIWGG